MISNRSFTKDQALQLWTGFDNYFDGSWWFALRNFVESNGFLEYPASTKHHCAFDGGLLVHTVNVTMNALVLNEAFSSPFGKWEVVVAGAMHDVGKIGALLSNGKVIPRYVKTGPDKWASNLKCPATEMQLYSLLITRRFVKLPIHIEEAISFHDGLYYPANVGRAHKEGALELILHYADYWACHCQETDRGWLTHNLGDGMS
jgi:hypothetical protein